MLHERLPRLLDDTIRPILRRPAALQVAALCLRDGPGGQQVLLITSRGTGRWILPKGWPMPRRSLAEAAAQEAWEEAGVRGHIDEAEFGRYRAIKEVAGGVPVPCEVVVFRLPVDGVADDFPEAAQRERRWLKPADAATLVREDGLRALLSGL